MDLADERSAPTTNPGLRDALSQLPHREMDALVEAMLVVAAGLDLDDTLQTITETATKLVDARYGALGIRGEGPEIVDFVLAGMG